MLYLEAQVTEDGVKVVDRKGSLNDNPNMARLLCGNGARRSGRHVYSVARGRTLRILYNNNGENLSTPCCCFVEEVKGSDCIESCGRAKFIEFRR